MRNEERGRAWRRAATVSRSMLLISPSMKATVLLCIHAAEHEVIPSRDRGDRIGARRASPDPHTHAVTAPHVCGLPSRRASGPPCLRFRFRYSIYMLLNIRRSSASKLDAQEELAAASFNQLSTHVALGTKTGWRIFSCAPYQDCHEAEGGVGVISMLFASSLVALVGNGERADDSPRRLRLFNTSTQAVVFELTFASDVLALKMNKRH